MLLIIVTRRHKKIWTDCSKDVFARQSLCSVQSRKTEFSDDQVTGQKKEKKKKHLFRKCGGCAFKIAFPVDPLTVTEVLPQEISNSNNRVKKLSLFQRTSRWRMSVSTARDRAAYRK